ncbi:NAD(P)-binding protein [Choiromyces venosus 120613-1]|uniref:NAD(P)-binding protein n=1 Tax=Choiromyces venosus 120613-1 TaxID=1336337 RepID=A0A3N4J228_9PEZI|nr:NAD(P)-binding protein [Choiromyces venosus 120613-1]
MSLTNKVALITGATKGIGKSIAQHLSAQGATVVLNYNHDTAAANSLLSNLPATATHLIQADVSSITACQSLINETIQKFSRIDILILNAGILPNKDLAGTTEEDFDRCFGVNVKGPYFLAQAAVPHMSAGGRVIFFSSSLTAASSVAPGYLLYLSTKGAIEQMTRVLAKDLGRRGITVNCVSPGPTGTELFYAGKSQAVVDTIASLTPANRIGRPEEIADVVGFLAGEGSAWVNGQNIRVNGGMA